MKNNKNHGVSFIEILVAVVIFAICIIPITNQLIVSIRVGQRADDQQAAVEYAESVAETMKQMELLTTYEATGIESADATAEAVLAGTKENLQLISFKPGTSITAENPVDGHKFYSITTSGLGTRIVEGSDEFQTITEMQQALNVFNEGKTSEEREALVREYSFIGVARAIDYRDYVVTVNMSTKNYALAGLEAAETGSYTDPNAVSLGNLSSLDPKSTVILTDTSNCDVEAYKNFYSRIITDLEADGNFETYINDLKNGSEALPGNITKKIVIDVTNPTKEGARAKVTCTVVYEIEFTTNSVGGTAAEKTQLINALSSMNKTYCSTELCQEYNNIPDIYLMYNQFRIDGRYKSDMIQVNNQLTEKATVNAFVIRTASTSENVINISPDDMTEEDDTTSTATDAEILIPTTGIRDETEYGTYKYTTTLLINGTSVVQPSALADHPVHFYTNILLDEDTNGKLLIEEGKTQGTGLYKLATNVTDADEFVKALDGNDRYSEEGRLYDVVVTLYDSETYDRDKTPEENEASKIIEFDTTKGDY